MCVTNADMKAAARTLSNSTFKVWLWFCTFPTSEEFYLKPADLTEEMGISLASYKNSINELIEKGYLIKNTHKRKSSAFIFRDSLNRNIDS